MNQVIDIVLLGLSAQVSAQGELIQKHYTHLY